MTQQNDFVEKNTQKVMEYVTHDILKDFYARNEGNPDNQELVSKIQSKYKQLYNVDINSKQLTSMAFIIPNDTDFTKLYVDKVQEICKDLGVNVQIDPTVATNKNDYVILTGQMNEKTLSAFANNIGITTLLKPTSDESTLKEDLKAVHFSRQIMNKTIVVEEKFKDQLKSSIGLKYQHFFVPDTPVAKDLISTIKRVREELSNSGGVLKRVTKIIN